MARKSGALTFTQQQQEDLLTAIASGAERVSYSDESVEYRSLSELREILAGIDADLSGAGVRRRTFRMVARGNRVSERCLSPPRPRSRAIASRRRRSAIRPIRRRCRGSRAPLGAAKVQRR
ncbi:phage head-tail joining protein [Bradyrhizobium sp. CCBAU 051011]|uniref:phage head-tail joining protein n=1 Tax=Bradyrhizobium sp. CCBAU 051011 TaxID=858422 RepID=UPI0013795D21|nr:hypothetical protein [Bradyrhizobium sp. CCBAU 051011]